MKSARFTYTVADGRKWADIHDTSIKRKNGTHPKVATADIKFAPIITEQLNAVEGSK